MNIKGFLYSCTITFLLYSTLIACNNAKQPPPVDIASTPEELNKKVPDIIRGALEFAAGQEGKIDDSLRLDYIVPVQLIYEKFNHEPVWSNKEQWKPLGDSLLSFLAQAKLYGLFPEDYHFPSLDAINKRFLEDTVINKKDRKDAVLWAKADMMLTDAFIHLVKDIKLGRLPQDSITLRKDSTLTNEFYLEQLEKMQQLQAISPVMEALEPKYEGYRQLKAGILHFLDSADNREYTKVPSRKDTLNFKTALQKRLFEGGYLSSDSMQADSITLAAAVKEFQKQKGIAVDGKVGDGTIRTLNTNDRDRFVSIAISMDRYKMLADSLPSRYVWINLPAYYMELRDGDSIKIISKIICGKPITRSPVLTSAISALITYPQWTIPESIIAKEVLPGLKKDTAYLAKHGYSIINSRGDEVNPDSVNWSKYKTTIPFKVVQGSGDENALGILKFNFPNKYAVYLHDTNQRYLFARATRSLSHGCVRVQEWEKLAYYIIRFDNKNKPDGSPSAVEDSLTTWLERKEKHSIAIRNRLPVYIRYITCEGKDNKVVFYEDIYGEDRWLREKYFAGK